MALSDQAAGRRTFSHGTSDSFETVTPQSVVSLEVPPLPLCFVTDECGEAWAAILGSNKRVSELAEKLRKVKVRCAWGSRKHMKFQQDAHLLTAFYSEADLINQLAKQMTDHQLQQYKPMSITMSFLGELVGRERTNGYQQIKDGDNSANFEREILSRFPASRYVFSYGWGETSYQALAVLADVLGLIESEGGKRYYQACFAAYACMRELIDTHVPLAQIHHSEKIRNALGGVLAYKLAKEKAQRSDGFLPLAAASSLRAALGAHSRRLSTGWSDPSDLLRVMSSLHSMWGEGRVGFAAAAEEVANTYVLPKAKGFLLRLEEAEVAAHQGARTSSSSIELIDSFKLSDIETAISVLHVAALSPLWLRFDFTGYFQEIETLVSEAEALAKEIADSRARIVELSQEKHLDVTAIGCEASRVSASTTKFEGKILYVTQMISDLSQMLSSVIDAWLGVTAEQGQRSGASEDDAQLLALAQDEVTVLKTELSDLKRDNHQALAKTARQSSEGALVSIDDKSIPVTLLRKIIREPKRLSPADVLTIMSGVAKERMKVLPSAWRSAQESKRFEYSDRLIELIDLLVFDYRDAIGSGRPDSEARNILGSAYSAKESHTVSSAPTMRAERTYSVDGEDVYFEKHLRIGTCTGPVRGLRLYFEVIKGVVVIGYCGKHLTVVSTN